MSGGYLPNGYVLTCIRRTVNRFLPGTALIEAFTAQNDGAGGFTETWTPVTNGTVACRIDPVSIQQVETIAASEGLRVQYNVTLPYDAPVSEGNRLQIGGSVSGGTYVGGTAYNIRQMAPATSHLAFVRCLVQRNVT